MFTLIRECFNDIWLIYEIKFLMWYTIHPILCATTLANNGAIPLKAKFKTAHEKSILKTRVLKFIIWTNRRSTVQHKPKSKLLKSTKYVKVLSNLFQCYPVQLQDPNVFFPSLSPTLAAHRFRNSTQILVFICTQGFLFNWIS